MSDPLEQQLANMQLTAACTYAAKQLAAWEVRKRQIDSLLGNLHLASINFTVRTTSMWSDDGEVGASATSKYLAEAIKRAAARHHAANKRRDYQVRWTVTMKVSCGDETIEFELPGDSYRHLLPGGVAFNSLKLRQG